MTLIWGHWTRSRPHTPPIWHFFKRSLARDASLSQRVLGKLSPAQCEHNPFRGHINEWWLQWPAFSIKNLDFLNLIPYGVSLQFSSIIISVNCSEENEKMIKIFIGISLQFCFENFHTDNLKRFDSTGCNRMTHYICEQNTSNKHILNS